jgi:cytochrome c-type biogenesis protein CcmH
VGELSLVAVLAVVLLGADSSSRFNSIGHKMICVCSCSQVLLECNHVGCPDSDRMIGELRGQIAGGGGDTSILNWFAAKYGAAVLAAPIRGGFDRVAWITPLAVFAFATLGTATLILAWKRRSVHAPAGQHRSSLGSSSAADSMRERIRRETEF